MFCVSVICALLLVLKLIHASFERSDIEITRWHGWRLCCFPHLLLRLSSSALRGHCAGSPIKMITVLAAYITVTPKHLLNERSEGLFSALVQSDRLSNQNTESDSVSVQPAHIWIKQSRLDLNPNMKFMSVKWEKMFSACLCLCWI